MLDTIFMESLKLAEQLRPQYPRSLGKADRWEDILKKLVSNVPEIYYAIYNNVLGTKRDIKEQELMDYMPGYRLIHILEFAEEKENLDSIISNDAFVEDEFVLPLLVNYSNDHICYYRTSRGEEYICTVMHDEGELVTMYQTPKKFLETICEFYKQGVYFLDRDGYLDYDIDKEGEIGAKLNPGLCYWE